MTTWSGSSRRWSGFLDSELARPTGTPAPQQRFPARRPGKRCWHLTPGLRGAFAFGDGKDRPHLRQWVGSGLPIGTLVFSSVGLCKLNKLLYSFAHLVRHLLPVPNFARAWDTFIADTRQGPGKPRGFATKDRRRIRHPARRDEDGSGDSATRWGRATESGGGSRRERSSVVYIGSHFCIQQTNHQRCQPGGVDGAVLRSSGPVSPTLHQLARAGPSRSIGPLPGGSKFFRVITGSKSWHRASANEHPNPLPVAFRSAGVADVQCHAAREPRWRHDDSGVKPEALVNQPPLPAHPALGRRLDQDDPGVRAPVICGTGVPCRSAQGTVSRSRSSRYGRFGRWGTIPQPGWPWGEAGSSCKLTLSWPPPLRPPSTGMIRFRRVDGRVQVPVTPASTLGACGRRLSESIPCSR